MRICIQLFKIAIIIGVLNGCENQEEDTYGNASILGYAYTSDTVGAGFPSPVKNQKIYLGDDNSTIYSFINSTITDSAGHFSFKFLSIKKTYKVFSSLSQNGLVYSGDTTIKVEEEKAYSVTALNLYPSGYHNRLIINLNDTLGDPLGNFPLHIYNNKAAALADDPLLAYLNPTTDVNGSYIKSDLTPNTYYITAKKNYAGAIYSAFDSVSITTNNDYILTMQLKPASIYTNELNIKLEDEFHGPLSRFPFRLYLSFTAALEDETNFAYLTAETNNDGTFKVTNLSPNEYYITCRDTLGTNPVSALDSITVSSNGVFTKTVIVR